MALPFVEDPTWESLAIPPLCLAYKYVYYILKCWSLKNQ